MKRLAVTVAALVLGCRGESTSPYHTITLSASEAWAGSPVVLTSPAFTGLDTLPVRVFTGANELIFIPLGATKIAVLMPQNDGAYALDVELHGGDILRTDHIRVHGFLGAAPGPPVSGRVQPAYGYARPAAIGYGPIGRLTLFNPTTGTTAPLGAVLDVGFGDACLPGVMPAAANPSIITLGRRTTANVCAVLAANVGTTVTVLDSSRFQGGDIYPSMYLGGGRWILGRQGSMVVVTGPASSYALPCDVLDIVAAPSPGIAVVPVACDNQGGVPIIDRTSGLPQLVLGNVRQINAAAFSPAGDTLYYAGLTNEASPQTMLFAADPVTGTVLDAAPIPALRASVDMTADPNGRWLYLVDGDPSADSVEVKVFDRATLDYAAIWHAPNLTIPGGLGLWRLIVGADRVLYLVATTYYPIAGSYVYRWALIN